MSGSRQYMTLHGIDPLDDENTVGVVDDIELVETTVSFPDGVRKIVTRVRDDIVGDEDSRLFLSCEDAELSVGYGPEFAPIETNLTKRQAKQMFRELGTPFWDIDLLFDDQGPVVFETDDQTVVATPMRFSWDKPAPRTTCGPPEPTIHGERE